MGTVVLGQHELHRLGYGRLIQLFGDQLIVVIEQRFDFGKPESGVIRNTLCRVPSFEMLRRAQSHSAERLTQMNPTSIT